MGGFFYFGAFRIVPDKLYIFYNERDARSGCREKITDAASA